MTLGLFAWISIGFAFACALTIVVDEIRRPQAMGIMNVVWPVTALYFSVFGLWAYFKFGTRKTAAAMQAMQNQNDGQMNMGGDKNKPPTIVQIAEGTSHCGGGCMIADVGTEFAIAAAGLTLFGSVLWTEFILDFLVAWALGIVFQYFALKPMRSDLSPAGAILAAIKADTLSILAFQVGMYLFMALVYFKLFPAPHHLTPFDPRYWLMMQIAMICGFLTSFPMNRLLIGWGLK
ncbi:MAG: DUF4396 domain-containing protein, partial [Janthinobacterium lividum]